MLSIVLDSQTFLYTSSNIIVTILLGKCWGHACGIVRFIRCSWLVKDVDIEISRAGVVC